MQPVHVEEQEDLARWVENAALPHMSLWQSDHVGCVMHTPGHRVLLTRPDHPQTQLCAALLCDFVYPRPFALSAGEIGSQEVGVYKPLQPSSPL